MAVITRGLYRENNKQRHVDVVDCVHALRLTQNGAKSDTSQNCSKWEFLHIQLFVSICALNFTENKFGNYGNILLKCDVR